MALNKPLSHFIDIDLVHKTVEEEFQLQDAKVLGEGMSGAVFLVKNPVGKTDFAALKVFRGKRESDSSSSSNSDHSQERAEKLFRTEVNVMRQCQHPNLMPMLNSVRMADSLCILMPYMSEGSLNRIIHRLTTHQAIGYFFQIADALNYLHKKKIIHGDIKPNNVLINSVNQAVLSDFGLSKCVPNQSVKLFIDYGTKGFRAPETFEDERVCPFKVDIYALGVTFWAMILKKKPGPSVNYLHHVNRASLIPCLKQVFESLLNKDPSKRISVSLGSDESKKESIKIKKERGQPS
ncbi:hypothetical protein RRG08_065987 [Elysia crispata]|uniref:Protein kinase domain-containing protein n=1 Tax=Elysia crispata TaxID=231223 RepID=A0AAE1A6B7_9GAST|nr:hypothetical protein RRG08_065987 [Elysia crispata]